MSLALFSHTLPATAEPPAPPTDSRYAALLAAIDPPPTPDKVFPALTASEKELNFVAETGCHSGRLDKRTCDMSAKQIEKLLPNLQDETAALRAAAMSDPAAQAMTSGQRTTADITKIIENATKISKNPAVKKLTDKASTFADFASRSNTGTGAALGEQTVLEYAKAAIYLALSFRPPLGDLLSLAEAISSGNIEQGIVAVIGLTAFAIGLAFPPLGAIISVGLAIYGVGKLVWSYFRAKPRDWIQEPPSTPRDLFKSGADIKWTEQKVNGEAANVVFSKNKLIATQTMLLNSRWTEYNKDRKPVNYTIPAGVQYNYASTLFYLEMFEAVLIVWQDGKPSIAECSIPGYDGANSSIRCGRLTDSVTISATKGATLEVRYILKNHEKLDTVCKPKPSPPCIVRGILPSLSKLDVLSEGKVTVPILLPFAVGVQP
ncbi:hypothetical protein [Crossiella cryophila]|uniref:Uncharacterized protein n=1 Tax=Crossiella cryophila TaxID=43355 RepID=A0A7W7CHP1_9PSEU|nr:hypothetical protein [Crossiella cryophila]MBB4679669.1 hypothetical protein [Crossiella cryophila]